MIHATTTAPASSAADGPPVEVTCRVAGLGGIGQVVAVYLARFLASRGRPARLVLIDGDRYEQGNETRMFFDACGNKAQVMHERLRRDCDGTPVTIVAVPEYLRPDNLDRLVPSGPGESLLLCVDNHATRKLVAEHVHGLDDTCVISGGNDGVGPDSTGAVRAGVAGNVQAFVRRGGRVAGPSLTKYHPEIDRPADRRPDDAGCLEQAASTPQILFANLTAAAVMLDAWYTLWAGGRLPSCEIGFDITKLRTVPLPLPAPPAWHG
ncbi:MAG: ThiF family adenylyltransferase [Planctomycetota bacterium]